MKFQGCGLFCAGVRVLTCQCVLTLNFLACRVQLWGFEGLEKFKLAVVHVSVYTHFYDVPLLSFCILNLS